LTTESDALLAGFIYANLNNRPYHQEDSAPATIPIIPAEQLMRPPLLAANSFLL